MPYKEKFECRFKRSLHNLCATFFGDYGQLITECQCEMGLRNVCVSFALVSTGE